MRKTITLLLVAAMLTGSLAACGQTEAETTAAGTDTTAANTDTTVQTEETKLIDGLPTADYAGADFRVYGSQSLGVELPTTIQLSAGETTGEIVNDTLFARKTFIEDHYNIEMTELVVESGEVNPNNVLNQVKAGQTEFEMFYADIASQGYHIVLGGGVHAFNEVENIHLDQIYWEQKGISALTIGKKLYFPVGPITPRFYGSTYIILFNEDMATELGLPDFYSLVAEGDWTMDVLMESARAATSDTNGDGKLTDDDRIGMGYEVLTAEAFLFGYGYHYIDNVDGKTKAMLDDENLINAMQKLSSFYQEDCCVWFHGGSSFDEVKMYTDGNLLFYNPCTFNLADFRELDYEYGILPMPKENAEQSEYIVYGQPWAIACPYIPLTITGEQLSMTGMLVDAMAAYGHEELRPAVFENVIQTKGTRNEQSAAIIEDVFQNITFDLASCIGLDGFYWTLQQYFTNNLGKAEVSSLYAAKKESVDNFLANLEDQIG